MTECIQYGTATIEFSLQYRKRKTLGISVTPDSQVLVSAPLEADLEKIKEKVSKRASWILSQQRFFAGFHPRITERRYVSGESHLYLGRQYMLLLHEGSPQQVKISGGNLEVTIGQKTEAKAFMEAWYRQKAEQKLFEIAAPILEKFKALGYAPMDISLRAMPTRWGSCTPKGRIFLNPELIKASRGCIEYVITHELCHLVEHNHTSRFYAIQTKMMPDWQKWKTKLEKQLA